MGSLLRLSSSSLTPLERIPIEYCSLCPDQPLTGLFCSNCGQSHERSQTLRQFISSHARIPCMASRATFFGSLRLLSSRTAGIHIYQYAFDQSRRLTKPLLWLLLCWGIYFLCAHYLFPLSFFANFEQRLLKGLPFTNLFADPQATGLTGLARLFHGLDGSVVLLGIAASSLGMFILKTAMLRLPSGVISRPVRSYTFAQHLIFNIYFWGMALLLALPFLLLEGIFTWATTSAEFGEALALALYLSALYLYFCHVLTGFYDKVWSFTPQRVAHNVFIFSALILLFTWPFAVVGLALMALLLLWLLFAIIAHKAANLLRLLLPH